jgi:hypothetical protein
MFVVVVFSMGAELPDVRYVRDFEWGNLKRAATKRCAENRMTELDQVTIKLNILIVKQCFYWVTIHLNILLKVKCFHWVTILFNILFP